MYLTHREFSNTTRDVAALAGRYGVTVILNLLFGLIFLGVGGKSNADKSNFRFVVLCLHAHLFCELLTTLWMNSVSCVWCHLRSIPDFVHIVPYILYINV